MPVRYEYTIGEDCGGDECLKVVSIVEAADGDEIARTSKDVDMREAKGIAEFMNKLDD